MNLETDAALSCYMEISQFNPQHGITIVQHTESRQIYVKKILDTYHMDVYQRLQTANIAGIPKIHELFEYGNHLILIEQYISGKTLAEYMETEIIDDSFIRTFALSLCKTVQKLHTMDPPVIHRDIKPSNIIITPQGETFLLDFNAAKPFSTAKPRDTNLIGTYGYAAPEQYGFAPSSPQTDIYALGIVIQELSDLVFPQTHCFDKLIATCTRLDPKDRYQSVTQLISILNQKKMSLLHHWWVHIVN